jgi:cytochrome c-type biogenesis protein
MENFFIGLEKLIQLSPDQMTLGSLLLALGGAYLGGILASLTPCIYPMIPITIGVMGGADLQKTKKSLWLRAFFYILGMALVYSVIGIAAGLSGRAFGTQTNTPEWYLAMAGILIFSALMMLDVITFDLQRWFNQIRSFLSQKERKAITPNTAPVSIWGALGLGATSGIIAAPCTTPVMTAILALIAKTQSVTLGFSLMLSFAFGLGTLLLMIALFTGSLKLLPRSGQWMLAIKRVSGLLILGFAQYLIYRAGILGGI